MNSTIKIVGQRIRNYRTQQDLSQEELAELAGCHHTYIGQIERGEKNATIESLEKISNALNVSLSELFQKIDSPDKNDSSIPLKCYNFISSKSKSEQEQLFNILLEIDKYKKS